MIAEKASFRDSSLSESLRARNGRSGSSVGKALRLSVSHYVELLPQDTQHDGGVIKSDLAIMAECFSNSPRSFVIHEAGDRGSARLVTVQELRLHSREHQVRGVNPGRNPRSHSRGQSAVVTISTCATP